MHDGTSAVDSYRVKGWRIESSALQGGENEWEYGLEIEAGHVARAPYARPTLDSSLEKSVKTNFREAS